MSINGNRWSTDGGLVEEKVRLQRVDHEPNPRLLLLITASKPDPNDTSNWDTEEYTPNTHRINTR